MLGEHAQSTPNKRRRTGHGESTLRMCPHCGRTFKRTEHLERHIRTHTKEKPFVCHCAAAFARRDLLSRHQRVAQHEEDPNADLEPLRTPANQLRTQGGGAAEADLAAAVSLSGLSVDTWTQQQSPPNPGVQLEHEVEDHGGDNFMRSRAYAQQPLSPQLFDGGIDFDPYFREFASFLDGVGLPAEWSPYFSGPVRSGEEVDLDVAEGDSDTPVSRSGTRTRAGTPFSSWLPSAPTGNHISSHVLDSRHVRPIGPDTQPYKVTEDQRAKLAAVVENHSNVLDPSFRLPSRHALTRYLTSFFEGFHLHMPFIHCPSWRLLDHSLELILGVCAIGAQYCFESKVSSRLFFAGKTILLERVSQDAINYGPGTTAFLALNSPCKPRSTETIEEANRVSSVETIRALIALMGFATWEPEAHMVREAFALQGLLTHILKDTGLDDPDKPNFEAQDTEQSLRSGPKCSPDVQWRKWIDRESCRRAKLIAFSFLHTHSIAYNVYPVLRSNEINLRLPCSTEEWKAPTSTQWLAATKQLPKQQLYFQEALSLLLRNSNGPAPLDPIPTPLGNYVLLHGLLQRIHIVRDLSLPVTSATAALPSEEVEKLECALRSWTAGWQQAPESSLDPNNESGPIPFTSSSLLAMAYIRIYLHLGPYRKLDTRDPAQIANSLTNVPDIQRCDGLVAALLYATHMLSVPVRLGVDRVARSQAFFWSVRHSLASLDCGILLSKWLASLSRGSSHTPPSDSEDRILHWVRCIVEEAYTVVDLEDDAEEAMDSCDPESLSLAVLKIWAHFFKSNAQWPFINIIGVSLEKYRQILTQRRSATT